MQNYIALFGGSFNPVHVGHIRLAIEVLEYTNLPHGIESVELIPCATPALKNPAGFLPFDLRVAMLKAACANIAGLTVSEREGKRSGASYTWHTLQSYKMQYTQQKLLFVLGMENLCGLSSWYQGLDLPLLADIGVMPRGGGQRKKFFETVQQFWPHATFSEQKNGPVAHIEYPHQGHGAIYYMPLPRMEISATSIRQRWLEGKHIDLLMPHTAQDILEAHASLACTIWRGETHGNT